MIAVSPDTVRNSLIDLMIQVADRHEPVVIQAENAEPAVLISLQDFEQLDTTAYLLSNPVDRERLLNGIKDLNAGKGVIRELDLDR